ncbi:hypothetical protein [Desulfallas thermosapovorans]|uniref:Uncharacterized protein n=1 Tax=Desulfallas thermosapovorans DSM 6562 TaxID=1121431 RepID=A0A5S4ZQK1_9FIRM|nr:hypothetical protein [Desulfallas thermosapovorans]TYO95148.1 hypothetical protein LX24_01877 [Desulfallas thermosapovorans DSM 6562]
MGRKNRRYLTSEQMARHHQEMRQAQKKLQAWQRARGHLKPVLRGFTERQTKDKKVGALLLFK